MVGLKVPRSLGRERFLDLELFLNHHAISHEQLPLWPLYWILGKAMPWGRDMG